MESVNVEDKKDQAIKQLFRLTINAHLVAFYLHIHPEKSLQEACEFVNQYQNKKEVAHGQQDRC